MIVEIKEYSFKTGKGIAIKPNGESVKFTYKNLFNETAIPVGKKASFKDGILTPATKTEATIFFSQKLLQIMKGK